MKAHSNRRVDDACYGVGSLASASFAVVPGLILLYYLTEVLAISAAVAALVVFIPKLFDVVVNPLVGRLSDRTQSRFGARRPWIFLGGILFPIAFMATFWTPYSGVAAAIWVAISFTLASMAFSFFVVPWSSLPAEIAPNAAARTSMAAWRIGFLAIAVLISGGLTPVIIEHAGEVRAGYRQMALFMGTLMIASTLLVAFVGARRSTPATTRPAAPAGFRSSLAMLRSSPPLQAMFWLVALTEVASAVALASTPYLAKYVLGDPSVVVPMFIARTMVLLLTMPIWKSVAVRIGKRRALNAALLIFAIGAFLLMTLAFAPPDARLPLAYISLSIMAVGFAGSAMLPQAMFADALAYETSVRGESNTGAMVGAWNAAETLSGGIGAAAFAVVLTMTGFVSGAGDDGAFQQSATAIFGIVAAASLLPALAALIALFPLRGFTLTEQDVDEATRAGI
ncbi:MAG: MFS transporter [Sphingopyxis sp.]|nr:MFS transporter [Sphingopyxis sp.]